MNVTINQTQQQTPAPTQAQSQTQPQLQPKTEDQDIEKRRGRPPKTEEKKRNKGIGVDCGTMFAVSAQYVGNEVHFKNERNAFFDVENNIVSRNMLNKLGANFAESSDKKSLYVLGNQALHIASFFNKECRRPFSQGVLSTRETEALFIIKLILQSLVGELVVENEKLFYSIPADPADGNFNNVYHSNVLKSFFKSFGYDAEPINEAFAIVLSELENEDYTGICLSFGSGSINIALSLYGISDKHQQFCLARSGDWVDINASQAIGVKTSKITMAKEAGVDLLNPKNREETAIKIYYENLISYACNAIEKKFGSMENVPNFPDSITVVVSGGTSKAINFDKLFEEEIKTKTLPFTIKQVKKASDPLNSVAKGCLLSALQFYNS
jgi:actin-like ATPase involved in cell morphogenesis